MPIRVIPDREHLRVTQDFQRPEFTAAQVRKIRDTDRRRYRRGVILLVVYQVLLLGPVRYAIDLMLETQRFQGFLYLKPAIIGGMVFMVFLIWTLGIFVAFRRSY